MSIERTQSRDYELASILRAIDEGDVALPEFQRDFDWPPSAVRSLLATVLNSWPMGSLLLIRGAKLFPFHLREIDDAPELSGSTPLVVLDGQQRLTALYHALYSKGAFRYVLHLDNLNENEISDRSAGSIDALEESLDSVPAELFSNRFSTPQQQLKAGILPVSALKDAATFFEWRDDATGRADRETSDRLTSIYRYMVSGLHSYIVPAVVVSPDVPPAGIARIFERVNRQGLPLGTFDLMVARTFQPNFNLRREWEQARENFPVLEEMLGDDGLPLLNVIALANQNDVRQRAVLDMPVAAVRQGWGKAVEDMDTALRFVREEFGVWSLEWLPYRNMLTVVAALADELHHSAARYDIARWFWSTAFGRRYDVASNTRAVSDFNRLSNGLNPTGGLADVIIEDMLECNKKQYAALHRSVLCLIASNRPVDLFGEPLASHQEDNVEKSNTQVVSLFPRDVDDQRQPPMHLRTLTMALVSQKHAHQAPLRAFSELPSTFLDSQMIPVDASDAATERFLRDRLRRITKKLTEKGVKVQIERRE